MCILNCPFCGSVPDLPEVEDVYGTCYEGGCSCCGLPTISLQIVDCFDYSGNPNREDLHASWDEEVMKYGNDFIQIARDRAVELWNKRVTS